MIGCGDAVHVYYGGVDFGGRIVVGHFSDVVINGQAAQGGSHSGSGFGNALAFLGDMDGDGIGDFAVANPNRTEPMTYDNRGSVYLFHTETLLDGSAAVSDPAYAGRVLTADTPSGELGKTMAVASNGTVFIGAPLAKQTDGGAFLFHMDSGAFNEIGVSTVY